MRTSLIKKYKNSSCFKHRLKDFQNRLWLWTRKLGKYWIFRKKLKIFLKCFMETAPGLRSSTTTQNNANYIYRPKTTSPAEKIRWFQLSSFRPKHTEFWECFKGLKHLAAIIAQLEQRGSSNVRSRLRHTRYIQWYQ